MKAASWPVAAHHWPVAAEAIGALFVYGPLVMLALRLATERPALDDRRWLLLAMGIWSGLQIAALAWGRSNAIDAPRYFDLRVFGLLVNAACALVLWQDNAANLRRGAEMLALACWLIGVLYGGGQKAMTRLPDEFTMVARALPMQTKTLKAFLATGDIAHLRNKPRFEIAYPSADDLAMFASDPVVRSILPPSLFDRKTAAPVRDAVLKTGPMLMPVGFALFMIALLAAPGRGRKTPPV